MSMGDLFVAVIEARAARRRALLALAVLAAAMALPGAAFAHVERPAYWPDPAADRGVSPPAGGAVPTTRTLASALKRSRTSSTRVVCNPDSLKLMAASIRKARKDGYAIRPTDVRRLGAKEAKRMMALNRALFARCRYREIQPAVTASHNNDRVVIMPGLYLEPTARAQPTHDPKCASLRSNGDRPGEPGTALSYAYQLSCPNDQNLIAVMGRALGPGRDPSPPLENRHGIPNTGPCIRCNLQIEGSGISADDVVIDAGDATKGNGGPNGAGSKKDVVIRADRADGFVLRKVTVRHAGEHGIYVLESDGYLLEHFKAFYNRLYGTLTFVEDHGRQQHCEAVGHGDSGIYPGAAVETGMQRPAGTAFRYNQEIRFCDLHHNLAGYSGTDGNAVHVHDNNFYGNSLGLQTDVVTAAGHPGFPGDSMLVERNNFYSNNFNPYDATSDIKPSFPFPVGTGMWIAGGNWHQVRNNRFWDNWRRGTMLFSVPDALICGPANNDNQQAGCDASRYSTSHYNSHYENVMGVAADGKRAPNGVDFWWDANAGSRGNCWYRNSGPKPITSDPASLPNCDDGRDPSTSIGTSAAWNTGELGSCAVSFETRVFDQTGSCPWFTTPPKPAGGERSASSPPLGGFAGARTSAAAQQGYVPLGQLTCAEWNATPASGRPALIASVQSFVGGVVNSADRVIGTGATLSVADAQSLFGSTCTHAYASGFLLYKLYAFAADFTPSVRAAIARG
jgi:hypothetical protein